MTNVSPDQPLAGALDQYKHARDFHLLNADLVADKSPAAVQPPQMWLLAIDPVAILERAKSAEIKDPTPTCDVTRVSYPSTGDPIREKCIFFLNHSGIHNFKAP